MTIFHVITVLIFLAAIFAYINQRFLHLQPTIGLMLLALIFALSVELLHYFQFDQLYNPAFLQRKYELCVVYSN